MPHPRPTVDEATRAYVYGYPLVYDLREVEASVSGHSSLPVSAPYNQFATARDLLGPETKFVTPNNDTLIEQLTRQGGDATGWRSAAHLFDYNLDALGPGTIDSPVWKIADRTTAYATRALAARAGLWGNHGYEATYLMTFVDGEGHELDGGHAYELRLPSAPPVGAFWSLSMYDVPNYYLVPNAIDRYSIGSATPELGVADDGSITITRQADEPSPDRRANWLPAPTGAFRPVLRMYMPDDAILEGRYQVPPITRIEPST